jgi:hypothetical protein
MRHRGVATTKDLRKQAAHLFSFENTLDANGHGRSAMRNLVRFRAFDHLRKRVFQNPKKFIGYFHLSPEVGLQALHPLEVRNN